MGNRNRIHSSRRNEKHLAHPLNKGNIRTGETTPYSNIALRNRMLLLKIIT